MDYGYGEQKRDPKYSHYSGATSHEVHEYRFQVYLASYTHPTEPLLKSHTRCRSGA